MNKELIGVAGTMLSAILLLFTAHLFWFLTLIVCAGYYGWNLGKRKIPAEKYGA